MIPAFGLLVTQHWLSSRAQLLQNTLVQATLTGASASAALAFDDPRTAEEVAATAEQLPYVDLVALYRADGTLLAYRAGTPLPPAGRIEAVTEQASRYTPRSLEVDLPIMLEVNRVGSIRMRVGLEGFYRDLAGFTGGLTLVILITGLLYKLASSRLRRRTRDAEEALQHLALHDRVTALSNRHAFELALDQTLQQHRRHGGGSALLFMDVDGFKKVNDLFGHHAGDEVLRQIAGRLKICLRNSDLLARIGGDEFGVILLDVTNPGHAAHIAGILLKAMEPPFVADGNPAHLGISIGVAIYPGDGAASEELLANADMAMYQAKNSGKNTYRFFSQDIGDAVRARLDLEMELRAAIQADQLFVAYQPQVDAAGGEILGMEALVRWQHPQRGLISPTAFIPVAEESDLILEVGDWVLQRVCRDIRELREAGLAVPPVAVNVSARQFSRSQLVARFRQELANHGLEQEILEIELTESVIMQQVDDAAGNVFQALADSGLRLAVDDFGTGYSSLSYLRRLPVDKLKIDRSFITHLAENAEDRAIVVAIIGIARALDLKVVAEGVETEQQAQLLRTFGCHLFQGFLTGRPMTLEDISARLPRVMPADCAA